MNVYLGSMMVGWMREWGTVADCVCGSARFHCTYYYNCLNICLGRRKNQSFHAETETAQSDQHLCCLLPR